MSPDMRRAAWNMNRLKTLADANASTRDHQIMFSPSARRNRKIILFAAAILVTGTSMTFAQGGGVGGAGAGGAAGGGGTGTGAGGARGGAAVPAVPPPAPSASPSVVNPSNPSTVPQQSSTPLNPSTPSTTPSTPSTASSGGATSPANEEPTTSRSNRTSKGALGPSPSRPRRGDRAGVLLLRLFTLFSYLSAEDLRLRSSSPGYCGAALPGVDRVVARLL
jgi:hypothetical protein